MQNDVGDLPSLALEFLDSEPTLARECMAAAAGNCAESAPCSLQDRPQGVSVPLGPFRVGAFERKPQIAQINSLSMGQVSSSFCSLVAVGAYAVL